MPILSLFLFLTLPLLARISGQGERTTLHSMDEELFSPMTTSSQAARDDDEEA